MGRCHNAIMQLAKSKQPKNWIRIVDKEIASLQTRMLAFFAGPMDDFVSQDVTDQQKEVFERVKSILRRQKSFKNARGLETIAHTGAVGKPLSNDVLRLLERSDPDIPNLKDAIPVLRCCAYIAANNENEKLAEAVMLRCIRLVTPQSKAEDILRLILLGMMACAAYRDPRAYHKAVGNMMARFAYRTPKSVVFDVRSTLELLTRRDLRMMATLGRAMAILDL